MAADALVGSFDEARRGVFIRKRELRQDKYSLQKIS